jgi:hypothetical protein
MATRKQQVECYVYRIFDGEVTVYVGKGSGRRLESQKRRFGLDGVVIEKCKSDDHAFEREVHWIAQLKPTDNILAGGNGGRCRPKPKPRLDRTFAEIERIGSRKYSAQILVRKLYEGNCEQYGVSKIDLNRLREVANGPRR